jgi:hypothetical protein
MASKLPKNRLLPNEKFSLGSVHGPTTTKATKQGNALATSATATDTTATSATRTDTTATSATTTNATTTSATATNAIATGTTATSDVATNATATSATATSATTTNATATSTITNNADIINSPAFWDSPIPKSIRTQEKNPWIDGWETTTPTRPSRPREPTEAISMDLDSTPATSISSNDTEGTRDTDILATQISILPATRPGATAIRRAPNRTTAPIDIPGTPTPIQRKTISKSQTDMRTTTLYDSYSPKKRKPNTPPMRVQDNSSIAQRPIQTQIMTHQTSSISKTNDAAFEYQTRQQQQSESQRSTSSASKTIRSYLVDALIAVKAAHGIDPKFGYLIANLENTIEGKPSILEQKVDQLLELTKASSKTSKAPINPTIITGTTKASLYSSIVKKGTSTSNSNTVITSPPIQKPKKAEAEERKLVLQIPDHKKESLRLDSLEIRNKINKALGATVVAMVTKSGKGNIVLTTTKEFTADYLLEKAASWKQIFDRMEVKSTEKPTTWVKLVAHGVPIQAFTDLNLLKDEFNTFNPVVVTGKPMWLTIPEKRTLQRAGSVAFSVSNETEKQHCLKHGLIIAGERVRVVNYKAYSPKTQCYRCQGYSHDPSTCRKATRCRLCASNHQTKDHKCITCNSSTLCDHIEAKCSNCSGNHTSNNPECEIFKSIKL